MRRRWPRTVLLLCFAMLAAPATTLRAVPAAQSGISWHHDLEAAKTLAKQTGRLVLVHFWTPNCAPCLTLDQSVFNQANVALAIESRFVPVKLNANENSATATGFGITRVPTDVILTPDGHVVGKVISPPTPGAYIAEVTQLASAYSSVPGQAFANAAANAPAPSQLNAAYANLAVAPNAQPAIGPTSTAQPAQTPAIGSPYLPPSSVSPATNALAAPPLATGAPPTSVAAAPVAASRVVPEPVTVSNPAVAPFMSSVAPPAASAAPGPVGNPYVASPPVAPPPAAQPITPVSTAPSRGQAPTIVTGMSAASLTFRTDGVQSPPQQAVAAAATAPAVSTPDPKLLPAGAPPLGFEGYCPVSMRNNWKWVPGDARWGIVHRGRTYWFVGPNEQQQFWSDPDRYSPALSGMDPVMAIDHQQQVPGKREHSIDYDNLFYMFSSEATLAQFTANPERYAVGVRQAMGIQRGRLVR
ncbi:MAG: thioredoxin family protein [Planctomycetes bacterium]|nr:thioredoxin family protein [Planctomycetota bacterium]